MQTHVERLSFESRALRETVRRERRRPDAPPFPDPESVDPEEPRSRVADARERPRRTPDDETGTTLDVIG